MTYRLDTNKYQSTASVKLIPALWEAKRSRVTSRHYGS